MSRKALSPSSRGQRSQLREVWLDGRQLTYRLTYKRVKNINLRIDSSGSVQLSAPFRVAAEECDHLVLSKWRWIQRALERRRLMENRDTAPGLSGQLVYLGERLPIVYGQTPGNRSTAVLEKGRMEILLTPSDSALAEKDRLPLVEQLLAQWQLEESQRIMDPVCQHYFSIFEPLGCKMPQIRYRRMKSQWGSYNRRTHVVTLNTRLLAYPLACVEYVVLHELTHMLYPDHQQGFHRFMASAMPDYRERRALLRSAV